MPNYVSNKLLFDISVSGAMFAFCTDGQLDFEKLIPSPPHKYGGNLGKEEDEDFKINWDTWNRANWGTKWNAGNGKTGIAEDGRAFIQFDTAWSVPYPVIVAIANRLKCAFEHRYFDEGENFWGIETWADGVRVSKRKNAQEDLDALRREFGCEEDGDENV